MWGAASMIMPMVCRDIDPYEKSIYIPYALLGNETLSWFQKFLLE
jgi:hypothetical protein